MTDTTHSSTAKRYGKYRGHVADNKDPEKRGRLKLIVPSVFGDRTTNWAEPCMPFGGLTNQGFFMIPEVNASVYVEFVEGEESIPVWTGCYWRNEGEIPEEAAVEDPQIRLIKTPKGHTLRFDDVDDEEQIIIKHFSESSVVLDKNGSILMTDSNESKVSIDAENEKIELQDKHTNSLLMDKNGITISDKNGNSIELASSGITLNGQKISLEGTQVELGGAGGEPLIKGQSFLGLFATHMHTCTAPGTPSSPPVPQGEMSTLTTKTKAG